jgi:YD repeat-containing protein
VAQTGEWTLYEATVIPNSTIATSAVITILSTTLDSDIWIDDVRVQPYDAQVMTYVYDNVTMRLLASFDDQHFGMYYQYNAEGKLVRKLIETEKGIKTVQETQYHIPLQNR